MKLKAIWRSLVLGITGGMAVVVLVVWSTYRTDHLRLMGILPWPKPERTTESTQAGDSAVWQRYQAMINELNTPKVVTSQAALRDAVRRTTPSPAILSARTAMPPSTVFEVYHYESLLTYTNDSRSR